MDTEKETTRKDRKMNNKCTNCAQLEADLKYSKAENTALKAQLAGAKAKAEILEGFFCDGVVAWSLLTKNNMAEAGEAMFDILNILSPTPEVLAVVECFTWGNFAQPTDQGYELEFWGCGGVDAKPVTVVVLPRIEGGE